MSKASKSPASRFGSFLVKYAGEVGALAGVVRTLANGIGLQSIERNQVEEAASKFENAAANILKSVKEVQDMGAPSTSQVKAVIEAVLPDILGGLIETEVRKRLAEQPAGNPDNEQV